MTTLQKHFRKVFIPVLALIALFSFALSSCEKNKNDVVAPVNPENATAKTANGAMKQAIFSNPQREAYIKKQFSTPKAAVSGIDYMSKVNNAGAPCGPSLPGCCRTFEEAYTILHEEDWVDCGTQNSVKATYLWSVYETICSQPGSAPINYVFTVDPGFGTVYTGNATLIEEHFEIINYLIDIGPKCYTVKTFEVTVEMPTLEYQFASSTTNTVTGTSSCLTTPQSITRICPLTIAYCGYPARGYVDALNAPALNVLVSTQCALGCRPLIHSECPLGTNGTRGLFEFRLGSSGPYTQVALTSHSQLVSLPQSGTYEYKLTLYYNNCSTTPLTGTFTK